MMRLRLLVFLLSLTLLPVDCLAAADKYGYPFEGPYEATILGTPSAMIPVSRVKIPSRQLFLDLMPEREKPANFFYNKGMRATVFYQDKKAPLVFIIPGIGSSDKTQKSLTMMRALYQAGFHVITLPSPTNANFVVAASRSCVPGDLNEDAEDLYRAMEAVWHEVKDEMEVTSFNIAGFSLGADDAAFVAKLDEERKVFNFRKVLMINPSVSLYTSMGRIEDLLKKVPGGPKKEGEFFNRMFSKFTEFYRYGKYVAINDDFLYAMYKERVFTTEETGGLIGLTFRLNLAGMMFASDVMTNSGYVVPKNRVLVQSDPIYDYFLVYSHLSFFDYFDEYFYPHFAKVRPGLTKQQLIDAQSLKSIEGYLKSDKFGAMLNENDFILSPQDLEYLRRLFGPRAQVYARGGHLGNLEYKDNLEYMVSFFKQQ